MIKRFSIIFLILLPTIVFSQDADEESELPVFQKKDSSVVGQVSTKKIRFTPFVAPAVSPEIGFMLIAGGLLTFKMEEENPKLQRSSIPFSAGYSTNGSFNASFRPAIFGKQDKWRLSGDIWLKDMPDNYWGVGYENGKSPSKPDSTTNYTRFWWQVFLKTTFKLKSNFYGGVLLDINQTKASDINATMASDPNVIADGTNIKNWSFGLIFQYDTRDFTVNAYEGIFLELSSNFYTSEIFTRPKYQVMILDYRQYKTIKRKGSTLAWQIKTRWGNNEVPWSEMSQMGTPFDLRGYRWGRYRDKTMLYGIMEYRYMFMRKKPRKNGSMMSPFGVVGWLATGSVGDTYGQLKNWLPNGGAGVRYEIQPRMNVRVDWGFGNDTNALYVSFNEAF